MLAMSFDYLAPRPEKECLQWVLIIWRSDRKRNACNEFWLSGAQTGKGMLAMSFDYLALRPEKECLQWVLIIWRPDRKKNVTSCRIRPTVKFISLAGISRYPFCSQTFRPQLFHPFRSPIIAEKVTVQLKNSLTNDFFKWIEQFLNK